MAYLLGIRDANTLTTHASRGALFETLVVSEWVKRQFNAGQVAELYFWRDSAGHEVDLLIPDGNRLMPVEIKSGSTFSNDWRRRYASCRHCSAMRHCRRALFMAAKASMNATDVALSAGKRWLKMPIEDYIIGDRFSAFCRSGYARRGGQSPPYL